MLLKKLYQGSPTGAETTTTPGLFKANSPGYLIKQISVSNGTGTPCTLSLSHVTSGGTGGAANRVITNMTINPDAMEGPTVIDVFWPMSTDDFITGVLSASGSVLSVWGVTL